jgi:LacI family transcriptional regulator
MVKAVDDVSRANGYTVLICNADEDSAKEEAALQLLLDRKVSGVINCSTGANLELLRAFQNAGVVLVDLDRESGLAQVDTVTVDNVRGAEIAIEHLVALGHRAICTIAGPQHLSNARGRLAGFQNTLRRYGIPAERSFVQFGNFKQDSGYDCAGKLLSRKNPPTAIFSANNEMTAGLVTYVREVGIGIPGELSIVGFDDTFWTRYMDPPLTVIAQPTEAMGECAIKLLLARLRGAKLAQPRVFAPELIVRGSTAHPRGA